MTDIPRAVPRWPGPKQTFDAWLTSSAPGVTELLGPPPADVDYWFDQINVVQLVSTSGGSAFHMFFQATGGGGGALTFWGDEVSSATGISFQFRGPFRILPGQATFFSNDGGSTFGVYAQGFVTNSANEA